MVMRMCTRYTINSTTSNHYSNRSGLAWLPAIFTTKTNAVKGQLLAESVERHFSIPFDNFDSNHFDEVNQFIEGNYEYFYPPEDPDDYRSDMDDDHDLVAEIDPDTLIRIVQFLKWRKAPITYTVRHLG